METVEGMHKAGVIDREAYDKITLHHLGAKDKPKVSPVSPDQIR
jgi:hypothetical protein